jgi:hypothetical protein
LLRGIRARPVGAPVQAGPAADGQKQAEDLLQIALSQASRALKRLRELAGACPSGHRSSPAKVQECHE